MKVSKGRAFALDIAYSLSKHRPKQLSLLILGNQGTKKKAKVHRQDFVEKL